MSRLAIITTSKLHLQHTELRFATLLDFIIFVFLLFFISVYGRFSSRDKVDVFGSDLEER